MCKSAGSLHAFMPASELYRIAEALLIVFKEHGDYEHRQRNRMKFMIKKLGWDRFVRGVPEGVRLVRGRRRRFRCSTSTRRKWSRRRPGNAPALRRRDQSRRASPRCSRTAPASRRSLVPVLNSTRRGVSAVARDERPAAEAVRVRHGDGHRAARRPDERADACGRRPGARVQRRLDARHGGSELRAAVGAGRRSARALPPPCRGRASGWPTPRQSRTWGAARVPNAAVSPSRNRGGSAGCSSDMLLARPDLVAKADGAQIKISGCPNGCGQHHVAAIGFQGSVRRVGGKAVPQYFVMVGGGTRPRRRASREPPPRCRHAAFREVVERLINYLRHAETGRGIGARVLPAHRSAAGEGAAERPANCITTESATPDDFIDLAETGEFTPEVMEGECAS